MLQPFLAKKIIITSNVHPTEWWPKVGLGAMVRRLTAPLGKVVFMEDSSLVPPVNEDLVALESLPPPSPHAEEWQLRDRPVEEYLAVNPVSYDWDNHDW